MKISFHKRFKKKFLKIDSKIRQKFNKKLIIFSDNPFDISLGNHTLRGVLDRFRGIDITKD